MVKKEIGVMVDISVQKKVKMEGKKETLVPSIIRIKLGKLH